MATLEIDARLIDVEVEATRQAYLEVAKSGCEACGCSNCANYLQARENNFPEDFRQLLTDFGIDWRKEVDAYSLTGTVEDGECLYEAEFHGFGHMVPAGSPDIRRGELRLQIGDYRGSPTLLNEDDKPFSHRKITIVLRFSLPWVVSSPPQPRLQISLDN